MTIYYLISWLYNWHLIGYNLAIRIADYYYPPASRALADSLWQLTSRDAVNRRGGRVFQPGKLAQPQTRSKSHLVACQGTIETTGGNSQSRAWNPETELPSSMMGVKECSVLRDLDGGRKPAELIISP